MAGARGVVCIAVLLLAVICWQATATSVTELGASTYGYNSVVSENSPVGVVIEGTCTADNSSSVRAYVYFFAGATRDEILSSLDNIVVTYGGVTKKYSKVEIPSALFWEYPFALSVVDIALGEAVTGNVQVRMMGYFKAKRVLTVAHGTIVKTSFGGAPAVAFPATVTPAYGIKIEGGTVEVALGNIREIMEVLGAKRVDELTAYVDNRRTPVGANGIMYTLPEIAGGDTRVFRVVVVKEAAPPPEAGERPIWIIPVVVVGILAALFVLRKKKRKKGEGAPEWEAPPAEEKEKKKAREEGPVEGEEEAWAPRETGMF